VEESLETLLGQAHDGRIRIPEFQRDLIMTDEWIRSLLASASLGYPIGAMTLLQAGNPELRFATRPLPGTLPSTTEPERLLVDGQRRLTALYQVLQSGQAVQTTDDHEKPTPRWYYVDIDAALDPGTDRDDAIVSVPASAPPRTRQEGARDLEAVEREWERGLFPLRLVFGAESERRHWRQGFTHHVGEDTAERAQVMERFETDVLQAYKGYVVPIILLGAETSRWTVRVHGGPDGPSLSDRFQVTARPVRRRN